MNKINESTNILFLDLDGPAYPNAVVQYHPDQRIPYLGNFEWVDQIGYWKMCERFAHLWVQLYNTRDFKVVISSSWRKYTEKQECFVELFEKNNLPLNLHDDWRTIILPGNNYGYASRGNVAKCTRALEIHEWLTRHKEVSKFMIFDDPESGSSLVPRGSMWNKAHQYMEPNTVIVVTDTGFGGFHIGQALRITHDWMK